MPLLNLRWFFSRRKMAKQKKIKCGGCTTIFDSESEGSLYCTVFTWSRFATTTKYGIVFHGVYGAHLCASVLIYIHAYLWMRSKRRHKSLKWGKKSITKSNNVQHIFAIPIFIRWLSTNTHFGGTRTSVWKHREHLLCWKWISWVCIFIKNFMFYILRLCNLVKSLSLVIPNGILCIVFLGIDVASAVLFHFERERVFDFVVNVCVFHICSASKWRYKLL